MLKRDLDVFVVLKVPSLNSPVANPHILALARLIGKQIAREYLSTRTDKNNLGEDAG